MTAENILDIFNRDFTVWFLAPRKEKGAWVLLNFRIEKTLNIPSPRCIVMAILVLLATKSIARIEALIRVIKIEMIFLDKTFKIWMAEEMLWVIKFKIIKA